MTMVPQPTAPVAPVTPVTPVAPVTPVVPSAPNNTDTLPSAPQVPVAVATTKPKTAAATELGVILSSLFAAASAATGTVTLLHNNTDTLYLSLASGFIAAAIAGVRYFTTNQAA